LTVAEVAKTFGNRAGQNDEIELFCPHHSANHRPRILTVPLVWNEHEGMGTSSFPNENRWVRQMILPLMILQNNKGQNQKDETIAGP
jgi:hypothetical protein